MKMAKLSGTKIVGQDIDGDGHCQFRSVAEQTPLGQDVHGMLRAEAVDYVIEHPDEFQEFFVGSDTRGAMRRWAAA